MQKKAFIFSALLTFSGYSQLYAQKVKVVDQLTRQPLQKVIFSQEKSTTQTNSNGETDLSAFDQEKDLELVAGGYQPLKLNFASIREKNFTIALTENAFPLSEVVVSVTRFAEKKKDVPQQVTVMSEKEIAQLNQPTSAGMLEQSGQVLVQRSQQAGGSPIMRGFEANKVLLVMDGVRLNNAIYRGGHLQNVITIDNTALERTELLFGPSSVVYGSDALGGVIHFYTKNPVLADNTGKLKLNAQAFTRYATANNEKTGHAQFSVGGQKFGSLTAITYSDFGDLRAGKTNKNDFENWGKRPVYIKRIDNKDAIIENQEPELQKNSGYSQYDILQKFLFRQNDNISHTLNLQYSGASDAPRYDRLTEFSANGKPKYAQWYYGPQKRLLSSYRLEKKSNSRFYDQLNLIAAYQFIEESRHDRKLDKNDLNNRIEKLDVYSVNADLEKRLKSHELRFGFEGTFNKVNSNAFITDISSGSEKPLSTRYPDGSTFRTLAAYLTHTWEISEKLTLTDGLRYSNVQLDADFKDKQFFPLPVDKISQRSGALSGNIGTVYHPGKDWQFSVLASTGFRAPNVDDMAKVFESVGGMVIIPNPELRPEKTYNLEAGIGKNLGDKLRVQATAWQTWYSYVITTQKGKFNGNDSIQYDGKQSQVLMMKNASRATLHGFSGSVWAEVSRRIAISSHLNYTYGRIKTDSIPYPLDHIPPVFGRTSIHWNMPHVKTEFYALYNGWKKIKDYNLVGEDNIIYATKEGTPAWYTLNLRMSYQINRSFQVQGAVENILDHHYRVFASGISAPGRNMILTLKGNF